MLGNYNVRCTDAGCFRNWCGTKCTLLVEPIKGHKCPFRKTEKEAWEGQVKAHARLMKLGRDDLIEKYERNPYRRGQW